VPVAAQKVLEELDARLEHDRVPHG
jgi:hypothetical protein